MTSQEMTKEKIENMLKDYKSLQSRIRIRLISLAPGYAIKGIDYDQVKTGKTNKIYSDVEQYVINTFGKDTRIWKLIRKRDIIAAALNCLTEEEKQIVKYIYFENITQIETGFELKLSESTIRSRKKEILQKLEDVGILKAYEFD